MKKFTETELAEILRKHTALLNGNNNGERADLSGADLSNADLSGADLRSVELSWAGLSNADLSGADLSHADLSGADLSNADLSGTDLSNADLSGADLSNADLSGTDLSNADLRNAIGNKVEVKSMHIEKYNITYTHDTLSIGYRTHLIAEWKDNQISALDKDMLEWWKKWKDIIFKIIEMSPAVAQKR